MFCVIFAKEVYERALVALCYLFLASINLVEGSAGILLS